MTNSQLRTLESYVQLWNTNALGHAFRTATELGLLDALRGGPLEAAQVAERCGTQAEPTAMLLDVLVELGAVERYGDDFALAPVVRMINEFNADLGDRHWQRLGDFLRTGKRLDAEDGDQPFRAATLAGQWMMTPSAMSAARALGIGEERTGLNILDLGAGSAVWSLCIAHQDPDSRVTVVDVQDAARRAVATAESVGLADRLTTVAADYQTVELPEEEYDLAVMACLVQLHDEAGVANLACRVLRTLKAGGEIALIDVFPGQPQGNLTRQIHRLELSVRTARGRLHDPHRLQALLIEAGFEKPTYAHLNTPPHTMGLMLAKKPE
jgi:ubiquinone/menaquinone biosynthesis C-methylase UbiE